MKLNIIKLKISFFLILMTFSYLSFSQSNNKLIVGANRTELFLNHIEGLNVAVVANLSSKIKSNTKSIHLIDSLLKLNIKIKKVFSPEHGFRGEADAGEKVEDGIDQKTGIPIISLHGTNKKPTKDQMKDIDVVIFDIQDVGARFYTYISTLHYVMEAVGENNKKLIILDRPNPNGHYVDGPILESKYKSFIGMHPVPVVYGMTIGEFGIMINEEGKKKLKKNTFFDYVSCANHLIKKKYTYKGGICFYGGSAGGLTGGAVANIAPELFFAMLLLVPFVDTMTTMLNDKLPLTPAEWELWGNPIKSKEYFEYTLKSLEELNIIDSVDEISVELLGDLA